MKKPSSQQQPQNGRRKSTSHSNMSDDDVRSSLDLLDSVIGEFDDGLTSAAESDYGRIEAEIRKRPPPKTKNGLPPQQMSSGMSLTDKIDDIFSELTEEIYSADKQQKIINRAPTLMQRSESTNSSNAGGRKLSPIRRVNDPLPTPPVSIAQQPASSKRKIGAKDEVIVYGEKERPKEVIPLKKSVKAQVHSLETRGRHHRVISTEPSPQANLAPSSMVNNGQNRTFTKNNNNRSRSENPPKSRVVNGMSLAPTLEDDFASRVNPPTEKTNKPNQPPPMPEKTKIHLKNESGGSTGKGGGAKKSSQNNTPTRKTRPSENSRQRRPDQPLPELPSNNEQLSSLPSSNHPYEMLPPNNDKNETKAQQYRRSRSLGPVVEAAQKELLASAAAARERSRSRGPITPEKKEINGRQAKSSKNHRLVVEEDNLSGGSHGRRGGGNIHQPNRPGFRKEGSSLESSRGRSRMKANVERSVSTSNKKPIKVDVMDPFLASMNSPASRMPARQKSMIDLREPNWGGDVHHHHPHQQPRHHLMMQERGRSHGTPPRHFPEQSIQPQQQPIKRPPMMRSATEHDIKIRNRRSMAVGPFEDLPPHIRQHMARQHGFRFNEEFLFNSPGNRRPPGPPLPGGGMHHGPMSVRDRQIAEEDALLMRHLTLESQREFLMRRGFSPSHPYISGEVPVHPELQGRLPFHVPSRTIPLRPDDYQRFKPEYWLQNHNPNPVAFTDLAVLQSELELKRRRELHRQNSQKQMRNEPNENNFNSLPWEEIIPRRIGGIPVLPPEHELREKKGNSRSKSQDTRSKAGRLFGNGNGSPGSGWFNPGHVWREAEPDVRGLGSGNVKQQGHWLLKERDTPMLSMPPNIDTLRDSGIGINEESPLNRNEPKRSSFGMALKDKFNKNPNMYFPGPDRTENNSSSNRSDKGSSSGRKSRSISTGSPTKTSIEDDMSDTDTLIHNMSDGSYEKDLSMSGDHDSFGSAKGSRSSGNSSLSPHNSMEGSPRMMGGGGGSTSGSTSGAQFQPNHSSGVSLGKKTIRNYTPKESSNMLREFEDRRNNSVDWRGGKTKSNPHKSRNKVERKSSVERMIDDFHRSLPPPPSSSAAAAALEGNHHQQVASNHQHDSTMTTTTANSSKRPSKNGTMNSQISNWSAASSAASFDYQPGGKGSPGLKKSRSSDLPSVDEDDDEAMTQQPHGERVPPEGAPSVTNGNSPTNFVHKIEVKSSSPQKTRHGVERRKSHRTSESEANLPPPPPPPPPPEAANEDQDDFHHLRKLISEGRIAGLDAKPPSFIPPSPPASSSKRPDRSASTSRRPSSAANKPPAPSTPKTPKSSHSAERQPSRKNREAPKPPIHSNVSTPSSDIKFVSSRQRESLEDLTQMTNKKRNEVKRSSSNHGTRPSGFDSHIDDTTTAQLIADSTEKKFNFNPFKGKLFKKKQYSFDFN